MAIEILYPSLNHFALEKSKTLALMITQKDHTFLQSIYETIIYITLKTLIALQHVL